MRNSPARRPDTFARAGHPRALRPVRRLFSSSLPPDVYTGNAPGVAQIKRGTPEGIPLAELLPTLQKINFNANSSCRMPVAEPGEASCSISVMIPVFGTPEEFTPVQSTHVPPFWLLLKPRTG